MMDRKKAVEHILNLLEVKLSSFVKYHSLEHSKDVIEQTKRLAESENITDIYTLDILITAAAFHDCGFLNTYFNHEEAGCEIAKEILPKFDYNDEDIQIICDLIMATKVPQNPLSQLQKIICDADLDYLGREDFFEIGTNLYFEFLEMNIIKDELSWNQLQVKFLSSHAYFTESNRNLREKKKQQNLETVKQKIK